MSRYINLKYAIQRTDNFNLHVKSKLPKGTDEHMKQRFEDWSLVPFFFTLWSLLFNLPSKILFLQFTDKNYIQSVHEEDIHCFTLGARLREVSVFSYLFFVDTHSLWSQSVCFYIILLGLSEQTQNGTDVNWKENPKLIP